MKTQQELMQAYWGPGGTVDMVKEYNAKHGCDVRPWKCIRLGDNLIERHPSFGFPPDYYTFALTILYDDRLKEHRPVFVGDMLYYKADGEETRMEVGGSSIVNSVITAAGDRVSSYLSWNPPTPKRTFNLEFTEEEFNHLVLITANWYSPNGRKIRAKLTAARDKE